MSFRAVLNRRTLPEGKVVFRQGDEGDAAYIVESGVVSIHQTDELGRRIDLGLRGAGSLIGEMAVIDGSSRMATATMEKPGVLIRIPADQMREKMDKADPFLLAVLRIMMDNLREAGRSYMDYEGPETLADHVSMLRVTHQSLGKLHERETLVEMEPKMVLCLSLLSEVIDALERRVEGVGNKF